MRVRTALFVLPLLLASATGWAVQNFKATLTTDQETGPAATTPPLTGPGGAMRPEAFGTANLILNNAQTELSVSVTVFNLDVTAATAPQTPYTFDDLVAAHIHAPAPPGQNAGVVWGFFGAPDHDTMPSDLVVTPFSAGVGGTFTTVWNLPEGVGTLAGQLPNLLAGLAYLNFHTTQFGGGEIRGQILAVPEPSSLALLGSGLIALLLGAGALRRSGKVSLRA